MTPSRAAVEYCKSQGVNISKLALHFVLENKDIPTTLVSTTSLEEMKQNLACLHEPLTKKEKDTLSHIMNTIFLPKGNLGWEGVEVNRYWVELGKTLQLKSLYNK